MSSEEHAKSSFRCERALSYSIPVVTTNFILESVKDKKLLDIEQYLVFNEQKKRRDSEKKIEEASELKSGKITIGITICFFCQDFQSDIVMVTGIFFSFLGEESPQFAENMFTL